MANMTVQGAAPTKPQSPAKPLTGTYVQGPATAEVEAGTAVIRNGQKSELVNRAQDALNKRGLTDAEGQPLLLDSKLGPKTEHAIRQFQAREMGMKEPSGVLDKPTLEKLGVTKPASWNAPTPKAPARPEASGFEPAKKPPVADAFGPPAPARPPAPKAPAAAEPPKAPAAPAAPAAPKAPAAPPEPTPAEPPKAAAPAAPTGTVANAATGGPGLQAIATKPLKGVDGPYPPAAYAELGMPHGAGGTMKTGDFTATVPALNIEQEVASNARGTFQLQFADQQLDIAGKDGKRVDLQELFAGKDSYDFKHEHVATTDEAYDAALEQFNAVVRSQYDTNPAGDPMVEAKGRQLLGAQSGLVSIHEARVWRNSPTHAPGQMGYQPAPMQEHALRTFDAASGMQVKLSDLIPQNELKALGRGLEKHVQASGPAELANANLTPFFDRNWAIVNDPAGGRPRIAVGFPVQRDMNTGRPDRMHTFLLDIPKGSTLAKKLGLE